MVKQDKPAHLAYRTQNFFHLGRPQNQPHNDMTAFFKTKRLSISLNAVNETYFLMMSIHFRWKSDPFSLALDYERWLTPIFSITHKLSYRNIVIFQWEIALIVVVKSLSCTRSWRARRVNIKKWKTLKTQKLNKYEPKSPFIWHMNVNKFFYDRPLSCSGSTCLRGLRNRMIKYENNPVGWQGEGLGGRERRGGRWGVVRWNSGTKAKKDRRKIRGLWFRK